MSFTFYFSRDTLFRVSILPRTRILAFWIVAKRSCTAYTVTDLSRSLQHVSKSRNIKTPVITTTDAQTTKKLNSGFQLDTAYSTHYVTWLDNFEMLRKFWTSESGMIILIKQMFYRGMISAPHIFGMLTSFEPSCESVQNKPLQTAVKNV